jgi:hypothetical protein
MQLFVVPRSIPMVLAIVLFLPFLSLSLID